MTFREHILKSWKRPDLLTFVLLPLSGLYAVLIRLRRTLYQMGLLRSFRPEVPVIVVGNITVGGTGKTPLVIYLVEELSRQGYQVGVISRGYGGKPPVTPMLVSSSSSPAECGDEPVLIWRRTGAPVAIGPDRTASIGLLLSHHDLDLIISDDGLQHYALQRDIELCVVDRTNPQHNHYLFPAGPLREPRSRLQQVDLVISHVTGDNSDQKGHTMRLQAGTVRRVDGQDSTDALPRGVHAVAGIGNPERFFETCRRAGYEVIPHPFADHHSFRAKDIDFDDDKPVLMTEKDAVKCINFASDRHWYMPVDAKISAGFTDQLLDLIGKSRR